MSDRSRPRPVRLALVATVACCAALGGPVARADDAPTDPAEAAMAATDAREGAVHFGFDEDTMLREGEIEIAWLVAAEGGPMDRVEIEGHADATGPEKYNADLSLRRARAVRDFLVEELGIERSALSVVAYGELYPTASNETAEGRAANRRVEFRRIDAGAADPGS